MKRTTSIPSLRTATLGLALAAGLPTTSPAAPVDDFTRPVVRGDLGAKLDAYLSRLAAYGMSGSILVARGGEVILHQGYGLANRETKQPIEPQTPFILASLSKQFTSAAILKLEMQGKVSVSDPVSRFFPDAPQDKSGITVHQLLSHTSGLPYLLASDMFTPADRASVMQEILETPLQSAPGERASYSSPGYTLLAGIVEKASGKRFETYLTENLFIPSGMKNTRFQGDPDDWPGREVVHSYSGSNDEGAIGNFPGADKGVGAGTVISTTGDLYRWELALRGTAVLSEQAKRKLFTPHADGEGPFNHAYGWNVTKTPRNTTLILHAGDFGGYNTEMRRYIDEDLVVIFASNMRVDGPGYRQAVMNSVSLLIAGAEHATPPAVVSIPPEELRKLAGTYRLPGGDAVVVRAEEGGLILGGEGRQALALIAGADPADSSKQEFLSGRAREILTATAADDLTPLQRNLHPSLPFEGTRQGVAVAWQSYRDSLGAFKGIEIIGTVFRSQISAKTYYRLNFGSGSVIGMFGWSGGKIVAMDAGLPMAMETLFLPESVTQAASFDMFTGKTVRIRFTGDGPGSLILNGSAGDVTARRSKKG